MARASSEKETMNTFRHRQSLKGMVNRHLSVATLGAALGLVSCSGEIGRDLGKENAARGLVFARFEPGSGPSLARSPKA